MCQAPPLSKTRGLRAALARDHALGAAVHSRAQHGLPKTASSVLGLSADEAVWFPLPLLLVLLGLLPLAIGCELFGDVCMVAVSTNLPTLHAPLARSHPSPCCVS